MNSKAKYGTALIGAVANFGLLVALLVISGGPSESNTGSRTAAENDQIRTVAVFSGAAEPAPSSPGSLVRVQLERGQLPDDVSHGIVATDQNCEPDAQGMSHCLNRIRPAGGGSIEVRHNHDMSRVACLRPGEKVELQKA